MIEILGVPRHLMIAITIVVLVAYVMYLLKRALLGQLIKATGVEQRVDVLPVLEALSHNLKVRFEVGVVNVQVTPYSPGPPLLLHWHFSHSLEVG